MNQEYMQTEEKIQKLLAEMTIEEKVGQLRQCGPSLVGAFDVEFEELVNMVYDGRISKQKFDELMNTASQDYHEAELKAGKIGSYNGISDAKIINYLQKIAVEETRLKIPLLFGYDVVHGYRTITPIPLAESCAWDPKLWEQTARISAEEASAGGIHMTFAPMVDVSKDARWGRISEGAGEDTFINSRYGIAKIKGFQGENLKDVKSLAACIKHFAGYGAVESGRDYNRVDISIQRLYEDYLPPYQSCVQAGARAVMPAFNDINGVPCTANEWLLRKVLREDWNFDGMTISDANAIAECVEHGIASNRKEAAQKAICAGLDMDMTSDCYSQNLVQLVENSIISKETLNQAVANVLRIKIELGLFENPYRTDEEHEKKTILKPEFRKIAKKAAEESMVLLKNDGILPLKQNVHLAVIGELADNRGEMTGTWAIKAVDDDCVSIIDACKSRNLSYQYFTMEEILLCEDVKKLLKDADVILTAVGETKSQSGEAASKANLFLPNKQQEALEKLKATKKPITAVLFNGRPLAIPWLKEEVSAILEAWHPGIEAGNAILDILFGKVNPSGKLTVTFPQHSGQCPVYYDHINTGRPSGKSKFTSKYLDIPTESVYPFGYGLSYTTFEYADLKAEEQKENICVSVMVKNTGSMDGAEIVQCYFHDLVAQRVRPVKKLVDFTKIFLKAGETKKVIFEIPKERLGYYDMQMKYIVEPGAYEVYAGGSSVDCLKQEIQL